jgi:hypothetical protein
MAPKGARKAKAKAKALDVGHKKADVALAAAADGGAEGGAEAAAGPEEHNIVRHGSRKCNYVIGFMI